MRKHADFIESRARQEELKLEKLSRNSPMVSKSVANPQ